MITVKQLQDQYKGIINDALKDMTQRDAAILCGVTEVTIRNASRHPHRLKMETLERIATKLKEAGK